jgi:proton glutamate symport protein
VKVHTKIALAMAVGLIVGLLLQEFTQADYLVTNANKGGHDVVLEVLNPNSERGVWLAPFVMLSQIFMSLLKMLIVPLVLSSIVTGVASISGGKEFGRLGFKTLAYYMTTSLFAIFTGLLMINIFQPGTGAALNLRLPDNFEPGAGSSFVDIFLRMIPQNVFAALSDNSAMLQIIVFALLFGYFIGQTSNSHGERMKSFFESFFQVMMSLAGGILKLIPYGVFVLVVKVVGETGLETFKPLLFYMSIVALALLFHACVVLPLLLKLIGGVSPVAWFRAMMPALVTAFSTSSSSMTLPVTMESVESRGGVSNKHSSFVLPLGSTVNMDGTALYECVGVIFLSQYYASVGDFDLTLSKQVFIVITALLASVGAAGIPSAGLIMMTAILTALGLPIEGAMLLLAIDRPLDMLRTLVNVWSDSCGAALVAKSEGDAILSSHD